MRTRKPCPGCGEADRYRHADSVCSECKEALKEYGAYEARVKVQIERGDKRLVSVADCAHWWPGFYYGGPCCRLDGFDETRDGLRELFDQLAKLVCEPLPKGYYPGDARAKAHKQLYRPEVVLDPDSPRDPHYRPRLHYPSSDSEHGGWSCALVDPALADVLQGLWDHVARFAHMSYLGGVQDGRNLLLQLASGGLSTDDLAEEDMNRAKEVQTAGRLAHALKAKAHKT